MCVQRNKKSSCDLKKLSFLQFIDSPATHMTDPPPPHCTLTLGGLRKSKTDSCHPAQSRTMRTELSRSPASGIVSGSLAGGLHLQIVIRAEDNDRDVCGVTHGEALAGWVIRYGSTCPKN